MEAVTKGTWIQCQHCGEIYYIKESVPTDQLYIEVVCAKCGCEQGLNCGDQREDVFLYYDPVFDARYY